MRKGTVAQRLLQSPCKVPKDLPFVCIWTLNDRVPNIQLCVLEVLSYPALCPNNSAHFIIISSNYLASSLPESGFYIWISSHSGPSPFLSISARAVSQTPPVSRWLSWSGWCPCKASATLRLASWLASWWVSWLVANIYSWSSTRFEAF